MKRLSCFSALVIVTLCYAVSWEIAKPSAAMAGGFPCWLCHGVNFEGSDLAPRVNGSKLTDAEILKQVHNPRGVMPAFGPGDWPDDATIIQYIRKLPPAGPTKTLTNQERAAALSTIAAVARTRAMAASAADYPPALSTPIGAPASGAHEATPASIPLASSVAAARAESAPTVVASAMPARRETTALDILVLGGAFLGIGSSIIWIASRR